MKRELTERIAGLALLAESKQLTEVAAPQNVASRRNPRAGRLRPFSSGSTMTQLSQYFWPRGIIAGIFDPFDMLAYSCRFR